MIATNARPTSQTPLKSSLIFGCVAPRGSERNASGSVSAPIGTLMRNTRRHPVSQRLASMSAPATIGAASIARPVVGPKRPSAFPSSASFVNACFMRPKPCGIMSAPDAP